MDSREDSHLVPVGCEPVLPAGGNASFHFRDQEELLALYSATMKAMMVERGQWQVQRTKTVDELEAQPHPKQACPAID